MSTSKKRWSDFSRAQQAWIVSGSAAELVLTSFALVDLARRPATQVRGFKTLWAISFAVQPIGPLAYLTVGRRNRGAVAGAPRRARTV